GQQRLTTMMLLLCVLRDLEAEDDQGAIARYNDLYLLNPHAEGDDGYRLLPTEQDRPPFLRWLLREPDNGSRDLVSQAYRFYRRRIEAGLGGGEVDLGSLKDAALGRFEIVEIATQAGDNVHRIFQSLNGTGVRL